jgi:hypothetical protein
LWALEVDTARIDWIAALARRQKSQWKFRCFNGELLVCHGFAHRPHEHLGDKSSDDEDDGKQCHGILHYYK